MEKLKRAVIKEELVKLTGNFKRAIVLNQFLYWTERVGFKRYEKFIEEEKTRKANEIDGLEGGWIYKTADDLADEILITTSFKTARRYCKQLVNKNYILERKNPNLAWDHTKQYRVNLIKVAKDLSKMGYILQGYRFDDLSLILSNCQIDKRNSQNDNSNRQTDNSECHNDNTIPEITTENTTKTTNNISKFKGRCMHLNKKCHKENIDCEIKDCPVLDIFNHYCNVFDGVYNPMSFSSKRKKKIQARLRSYSVDVIKKAITNIRKSKYHCGDNKSNKVYAKPEFICRNDNKIEEWFNHKVKGGSDNDKSIQKEIEGDPGETETILEYR